MNQLLEKFIPTANMLAETLGADCQVVIYDFATPSNMEAYTVNDCVNSGEMIQYVQPVFAQRLSENGHPDQYSSNYLFITGDKRLIRTSISFISDDMGKAVGAFCIHIDTKKTVDFVNWLLESVSGVPEPQTLMPPKTTAAAVQQPVSTHISEIANEVIDQIVGDRDASEMSREDKVAVVNIMEQRGLFLVKGSIEKVAEKLGIAKVTVYSYLDEIKDKGGK